MNLKLPALRRLASTLGTALLIVPLLVVAAVAESEGVWTAETVGDQLRVQLRMGEHLSVQLSGPRLQSLITSDGPTRFDWTAEAGTLRLEGSFLNRKGAGHFRFIPNEAFAKAMAALGYPRLEREQVLLFTATDFPSARVKELAAAGFPNLTLEQLVEAAALRVTPELARGLREAGYPDLAFQQLVEARALGVTPARIRELAALGYGHLRWDTLIAFQAQGITPEYVRKVRAQGYPNATADELIQMKAMGIDEDYIRSMSKAVK